MRVRPLFVAPAGNPPPASFDVLASVGEYDQLRVTQRALNDRLTQLLTRADMGTGARRLGLLDERGRIVFGSEDETSVFMDYCIYDVRRDGKNAVDRLIEKAEYGVETEERRLLAAMAAARFSVFQVERISEDVALRLRDLLYGDRIVALDHGLGASLDVGRLLAGRFIERGAWWFCSGAGLPLQPLLFRSVGKALRNVFGNGESRKRLAKEETAELSAIVLVELLAAGVSAEIQYLAPQARPKQ